MSVRKIKSKSFSLKKEAVEWAKEQKKKAGPTSGLKWEPSRTNNPSKPWEAILYRGLK